MALTVQDIISCIDETAPFAIAESWDNVGLLVGDKNRLVSSVLVALDPTSRLLDEAVAKGADMVITHHPAIFKPLPNIDTADPEGQFLEKALVNRLSVLACHTNLDSAREGVNDTLARLLGLEQTTPLVPSGLPEEETGLGKIGYYPSRIDRAAFIEKLLQVLDLPSVQVAGVIPKVISCVAVCGGSGSGFAKTARNRGADLYLSAEIKHDIARWAEEAGFCVIDGTHYSTEKPAVTVLATRLRDYARKKGWKITIEETTTERHPFVSVDAQKYL